MPVIPWSVASVRMMLVTVRWPSWSAWTMSRIRSLKGSSRDLRGGSGLRGAGTGDCRACSTVRRWAPERAGRARWDRPCSVAARRGGVKKADRGRGLGQPWVWLLAGPGGGTALCGMVDFDGVQELAGDLFAAVQDRLDDGAADEVGQAADHAACAVVQVLVEPGQRAGRVAVQAQRVFERGDQALPFGG